MELVAFYKHICILVLIVFLWLAGLDYVKAQCPVPDFAIQNNNVCLNENIELINSSTANSFLWDFCSSDLLSTPQKNELGIISQTAAPFGFKTVKFQDNWHSFITNRNTNTLIRLDYGSSLSNFPIVVDLGNPGNFLSSPEDIDIIQIGGNWYALITLNLGNPNNTIVLYEFGPDILSMPAGKLLGNFGITSTFRGVSAAFDGTNIVLAVAQSNFKITIVNYRDSFDNTIDPVHIITTNNILNASTIFSVDIYNECDQWYIFCASNNYIHKLYFGNLLFQNPISENSYFHNDISSLVFDLDVINEGGSAYVFVGNLDLPYLLFDFGNLSLSPAPVLITNTASPTLTDFSIQYNKGEFILSGIDQNLKNLTIMNYKSDCGVSSEYSANFNPQNINYSLSGLHSISLNAVDMNGNNLNIAKAITVTTSLAPQLTTQITGNCLTSPINFSAQQLTGNITNWNWDFGDGLGTSTIQNDTYSYATPGTYHVKLNVTDINGCNNLVFDSVQVFNEPIPGFSLPPGMLCENNSIGFTNTTSGESGPSVSWTWNFNGEGVSNLKDPTFTFSSPGDKTISLTSSLTGCSNVTQQVIFIEEAPATIFSFDNVCNGQTTTFTDLSTGNNLASWNWEFGDGNISTNQNPTHSYSNPGTYPVSLTVSNSLGCNTTLMDTVFNHSVPTAAFTNDLPCSSAPVQFSDQSIVQNANIASWLWDFGDGTTSMDQNPLHQFSATGDFMIKLKSFSEFGCVDSIETTISVLQGPDVIFSWDKSCAGDPTTFNDQTNSSGIPITDWTWIIDNQVLSGPNPQYSFPGPGLYPTQLSVTTANLCAQTMQQNVIVVNPPNVAFNYLETCTSNNVAFSDQTVIVGDTIISREWRIDGAIVSIDSSFISDLSPGQYMVTLTISTSAGCEEVLQQQVQIEGAPVAGFSPDIAYGALPLTVSFTNISTGSNNFLWHFGNIGDSTSNEMNPIFIYDQLGIYQVKLIAYSEPACADTTTSVIEVVVPKDSLQLDAITVTNGGLVVLTLTNNGSVIYDQNNLQASFSLDNSAQVTEVFQSTLSPQQTINYTAGFSLINNGATKMLCVALNTTSPSLKKLSENCISLNDESLINTVYPNPAINSIHVSVVLTAPGNIKITLFDRNGATLMTNFDESGKQGLNSYTIDTIPYRSGLYILMVETIGEVRKMKFVIDR